VSNAIENLRGANLVRIDFSRSNRAERYRQVLDQALDADDAEISLLAVLMLRGPQTSAELRARCERLHGFDSQEEAEAVLAHLAARPEPLVMRLAPMPGQKESRWAHLLSGEVSADDLPQAAPSDAARTSRTERIEALEALVADLTEELARLRADHDALATLVQDRPAT
jgi:uncharacterized protein YceH (UPF0502 family)